MDQKSSNYNSNCKKKAKTSQFADPDHQQREDVRRLNQLLKELNNSNSTNSVNCNNPSYLNDQSSLRSIGNSKNLKKSEKRLKRRAERKTSELKHQESDYEELRNYLGLAFKNSLGHMHDHIIATLPREMSLYYQKLHDTLIMNEEGRQCSNSNPTATTTMNEMHEFIAAPTEQQPHHQTINRSNHNPYAPPPHPKYGFLPNPKQFINDPFNTSLSTLNRVTNLVRSPTQIVNQGYNIINTLVNPVDIQNDNSDANQSNRTPGMAERVVQSNNGSDSVSVPPPVLPLIQSTHQQMRFDPLSVEEFEANHPWTIEELKERVFRGGISHQLRLRLWPFVLGLCDEDDQNEESVGNIGDKEFDWSLKSKLFEHYRSQWQSILAEQEKRFMLFRERKSLIERDVIRCDRTHPFYRGEKNENLDKLKQLLLTYMMYDFDTGYVQGMSDLASPLLYVADGDTCKAFWFFVYIMQFTKHNFEFSQMTIKHQLEMLWKLIELTDPIFAQYLANNESTNCYFAFRWIVCQFKREFMKSNSDDYQECLLLWESIWTCSAIKKCLIELKKDDNSDGRKGNEIESEESAVERNLSDQLDEQCRIGDKRLSKKEEENADNHMNAHYQDQEKRLSDTELYVLCICLAIIRAERDLIMSQRFDATEILKHFNTLELASNLKNILVHAANIWSWLIFDDNIKLLYCSNNQASNDNLQQQQQHRQKGNENSLDDDFDLLQELRVPSRSQQANQDDYYVFGND